MARCKEVAHGECSQFGSPTDSIDLTRKESNLFAHSQDQTTSLLPLHTRPHVKKHFSQSNVQYASTKEGACEENNKIA